MDGWMGQGRVVYMAREFYIEISVSHVGQFTNIVAAQQTTVSEFISLTG